MPIAVRLFVVVSFLVQFAGCKEPRDTGDAAAGPDAADHAAAAAARDAAAAASQDAAAAPGESPRTPTLADELPALRKLVRQRSLLPGTALADDLPFYRLRLDLDTTFMTYTGRMELWVKNRSDKEWNELHFHLYPNFPPISGDLRSLKVVGASVAGRPVPPVVTQVHVVLPLADALPPGRSTEVAIEFAGVVKRGRSGEGSPVEELISDLAALFGGGSGDFGIYMYSSGILSLALWYPVLAAYDAEGWDKAEPSTIGDFSYFDVADYLVDIRLDDDAFQTVGTGVLVESSAGRRTFAAAGVREFTLLAGRELLSVSKKVDAKRGTVEVSSWATPANAETQRRVLATAASSLETYERIFGPYPYPELDVVQADLLSGVGGVEFPGLVTIASLLYLDSWRTTMAEADAVLDSRFMRETLEFVVSHEVAHQWWNAVVGSHSRKHPFIDEALATYSSILYFERTAGKDAADRQLLLELALPYQLHRFLGGADRPVDGETSTFTDLMEYSAIVYAKGGLFLHALREKIGDDRFLQALRSYYEAFAFKVAVRDDLVGSFAQAASDPEPVRTLAVRWLDESHGTADVGALRPEKLVPLLIRELNLPLDGWLKDQLMEPGLWEAVRLGVNFALGKEDPFEGIDEQKITEWSTSLVRKLLLDMML